MLQMKEVQVIAFPTLEADAISRAESAPKPFCSISVCPSFENHAKKHPRTQQTAPGMEPVQAVCL